MENFRPYIFLALFSLFFVLEFMIPKRSNSYRKRKISNFIIFISGLILMKIIFPLGLGAFANYTEKMGLAFISLSSLPLLIEILAVIFIFDFCIYWQHRASHVIPILWRFHHTHHSDKSMDLTTALRFHPLEIFLSGLYKIFLILLLSPRHETYLLYESMLGGFALFNHSNIELPYKLDKILRKLIATPDFHSPHHSPKKELTNSNYGNILSLWDYLFNSYSSSKNQIYGLDDTSDDDSSKAFRLIQRPFLK